MTLGLHCTVAIAWSSRLKIYPTLNLQCGHVVSTAGQMAISPEEPLELAMRMVDGGATRLALVDVDAALGKGNNRDLISQILKGVRSRERKVCVQVAGGIRSSDQAQFFIDQGANWLVAGTILHKSPMAAEQLMARFQTFLIAAIDARSGMTRHSGWAEASPLSALELAQRAKEYGFLRLLFVDIPESAEAAPDFTTACAVATTTGLPLIMGGSITRPAHLEAIHSHREVKGALVDALLFEGDPRLLAILQAACA